MIKKGKLLAVAVMLLSFLTACSDKSEKTSVKRDEGASGDKITFLSNFPSETLDPHMSNANYTPLRAGIAETLVKVNENLELEPWLAKEWKSEENGLTWHFTIREGITFHNKKPLTADAVKASLERNIEVSQAIKAALKIKSMEASGQDLKITTEQPLPHFPSELVHPNTVVIDTSQPEFSKSLIGTGPFKVADFEAGSRLELKRYDEYWEGRPKLKEAVLTFNEDANARTLALQSGDADIVYRPAIESIESLSKDSSIVVDVVPSLRTHLLMYNTGHEAFKDIKVRQAFDLLLNREEIVKSIVAGQAEKAEGPFLPEFPFSPQYTKKEFSLKKAQELLEDAGYKISEGKAAKDGKALSLNLLTYSYRPELPLIAQMLQSDAKKLGIQINIQLVENIDEYLAAKEDWDLAIYSLITSPRGDASYFLNSAYMPGGAINPANIGDETLASIIHDLNGTVDEKERIRLSKDAVSHIDKEVLHSFIIHPSNIVAYKDNIKNWKTTKSEYYMLTKDLSVEAK